MVKINMVCIGKIKDKYIRDLAASGYRGAYNYISLPNRKYEWFRGR